MALTGNHIFLKLLLTPLIISFATLVSRRWGERIGGLLIGLPLTSAPVSVFFAVEQGPAFAASAALGSILGLVPVAIFCVSYVKSAKRLRWGAATAVSIGAYLVSVWGISNFSPGLGLELALVPAVLTAGLYFLGKFEGPERVFRSPWWDLPLRMVVATALLVTITAGAGALGPKWGGLLSPFPIFTIVMAAFAHAQGGAGSAWRLIRGVLTGLFAYTAFFAVVALLADRLELGVVYAAATALALGVNGISLTLFLHFGRGSAAKA